MEERDGEVGGSDADEVEDLHPDASIESSMHLDLHPSSLEDTNEGPDSDSEDDEQDDPSDVAMVPIADLLNARWGSENVSSALSSFAEFVFCVNRHLLFSLELILGQLTRYECCLGKAVLRTTCTADGDHKEH